MLGGYVTEVKQVGEQAYIGKQVVNLPKYKLNTTL